MRFAYIDSQGNEVEIPSEDALRLRIELGAIVSDTSLYDGAADRWVPAGEHDLYRRLRRDLDGDGPAGPASAPASPAFEAMAGTPWNATPAAQDPEQPLDGAWSRTPQDEVPLVPEGEPVPAAASTAGESSAAADDGALDFSDFGVLDLDDSTPVAPRASAPSPDSPERGWEAATPEMQSGSPDPWTMPGREPWPPPEDAFRPSVSAGPAAPAGPAHPFDAEESTPEWLRNDPDFAEAPESHPYAARASVETVSETEPHRPAAPAAPAPNAAIRRAAPKRRIKRSLPIGRILGGFAVVMVVGGGAFWFMGRDSAAAEPSAPEIVLPEIAPSLEPVLRSVSAATRADLVGRIAALPFREDLPAGPDEAWLGGRYMATAGSFPEVRLYWESFGRFAQIAQAREDELFDEALSAALDSVALPDADRAAVLERARAGFDASAPERDAVYGQLRSVIEASLTLHTFLEQNEANIDYEPADAGLSRDPVLEAVPITDALGDEMWNRVAEITSALDAVGYLDQVSTDGLLEVFFGKLAAVPIR